MGLFDGVQMPQMAQGLFSGIAQKLQDPAVKAGLLQAGMSMMNANPMASPFQQLFSGVGSGMMATQRYRDLASERELERQNLLNEQRNEELQTAMRAKLDEARYRQIENSIRNSQENTKSMKALRAAQTEKARRGPMGFSNGGDKAANSAWRAYLRNKTSLEDATPENLRKWKAEFEAGEALLPSRGASGTAGPAESVVNDQREIAIQNLMELDGYTREQAEAQVDSVLGL